MTKQRVYPRSRKPVSPLHKMYVLKRNADMLFAALNTPPSVADLNARLSGK